MSLKRIPSYLRWAFLVCLATFGLAAAEHHGQVKFNGLPIPGATVTMTQGDKKLVAVTDQQGAYSFPDLAEGIWSIQVEMLCFAPIKQDVGVAPNAPSPQWELKLLPLDEIKASAPAPQAPPPSSSTPATASAAAPSNASPAATTQQAAAPSIAQAAQGIGGNAAKKPAKKGKAGSTPAPTTSAQGGFQRTGVNASPDAAKPADTPAASPAAESQGAADGFLINGSQNNGAASPFAQNPAFGNNRRGFRSPYQASITLTQYDNSTLDANNYSVTGQFTPKPASYHFTGNAVFGGPLTLKHIIPASRYPINFFLQYQWARNRNGTTTPGTMPTPAERAGDFSQVLNAQGQPVQIFDPVTGQPFLNNVIPQSRISPQAQALLSLYPEPNFVSTGRYNYQVPVVAVTVQDSIRTTLSKTLSPKNTVNGTFAYQWTSSVNPNLLGFGFTDTGSTSGSNTNVSFTHRFSQRVFATVSVRFSRFVTRSDPFFANRENISGEAGITGNNQDPQNWGPPTLSFSSGIAALSDGTQSYNRSQTGQGTVDLKWNRRAHNLDFGGDYSRLQTNILSQNNPRGSFIFNGESTQQVLNGVAVAGTGADFAGFLLGIPDQSQIAFGNADKYLRSQSFDGFVQDDWRVRAGFSVTLGLRWDYSTPVTELFGRLVNLDITPGFGPVQPVLGNNPIGPLTGQRYPDALIHPDKHEFQPRVALAWHPFLASSLTIRAGYGVNYDTSVYQTIAARMDQQSPFSKSLSVQNSPLDPLTLANGFNASPNITTDNYAVDPNFRVGYVQTWQVSAQRDLPAALIVTATYLGNKGTRAQQLFYPNTYPLGVANPCPVCLAGYSYLASNGNSTREAGTIQLRRRLHNGFQAALQYTLSKAIDDAGLGGKATVTAQNWLNLSGERGLSSFDPHHSGSVQLQYSTGVGVGGGALLSGWRGLLFKEWTFVTGINLASGLPLTPFYPAGVAGTGFSGSSRPDYTGAPLYAAPAGLYLNPSAFVAPPAGQWGNAGRDTIIGPTQFNTSASMGRSFTVGDRHSVDLRFDASNPINHVTLTAWNTTLNPQFGLPVNANQMRVVKVTLRLRY